MTEARPLLDQQRLPRVADGGEWARKIKLHLTINDAVETIHAKLLDNEDYLRLIEGVFDEHAVEGSLAADNVMAAQKIREVAKKENSPIAREKLATISKAINIVMRRYGVSRKERRNMVGGQGVPTEQNGE